MLENRANFFIFGVLLLDNAPKEAIESLLMAETKTILGYDRHDPSGKNSGDPKNRYEKASTLIKMAISANKVIRYRDLYGKKD